MKLFSKLAVAFLCVVTLLSCSKDEDTVVPVPEPTLEGKWEFSEYGYIDRVAKAETVTYYPWRHGCASSKDSRTFVSDGTFSDSYLSVDCKTEPYAYTWAWKEKGKSINLNLYSKTSGATYEIVQLDATTLKLKFIGTYGVLIQAKAVREKDYLIFKEVNFQTYV